MNMGFLLDVIIHSGRNLIDYSSNKKNKIQKFYCKIILDKEIFETCKEESNNPKWETIITFKNIEPDPKKYLKVILLNQKNKSLGYIQIFLHNLNDKPKQDQWYPLLNKKGEKEEKIKGEIRIELYYQNNIILQQKKMKEMEEKLKKEKEELFYSKNNSSLSLTTINKEIENKNLSNDENNSNIKYYIDQTEKIKIEAKKSTTHSIQLLENSLNIGAQTAEKLSQQGEQLRKINNDTEKMDVLLYESGETLKGMRRWFGNWTFRKKTKISKIETKKKQNVNKSIVENINNNENINSAVTQAPSSTTSILDSKNEQKDELDEDLNRMSLMLGNLKKLASDMGDEIVSQEQTINNLLEKTDKNRYSIAKQMVDIRKI